MSNIIIRDRFENKEYAVDFTTFSDSAENCKIVDGHLLEHSVNAVVQISVNECTRDMTRIELVKDALDRLFVSGVSLSLAYMPNARADRVFEKGMAHPLALFAKRLNACQFDKVYLDNPHSDVTSALINNVEVRDQNQCFKAALPTIKQYTEDFVVCAPDLGATKKVFDTVVDLQLGGYVQVSKIRDVTTGDIVKCELASSSEFHSGKDVVIIDDISDRGGSFIHVSKLLKSTGAKRVFLYVTHGIFPDGLDALKGHIDGIFCSHLIGGNINTMDLLTFNEGEVT